MGRRIAVAGASGFVGTRLAFDLAAAGHEVVVLGRTLSSLPEAPDIERRAVDVADGPALTAALDGCHVAYYLVHSMAGGEGFETRDRELAASFAAAARRAGVTRIVYLGALGGGDLSPHLASRQEVGRVLASTGVEVVELRAAVVLGAGSISFEMLRYLVERLPAMVCPRWVRTRIQPLAFRDVLRYLLTSLDVPAGVYDVGMRESTSYREMMDVYAEVRGLRRRLILDVPLLTLNLSSYWVDFVTPVDRRISHTLIESLANEVVARDPARTREVFGFEPMPLRDAMRRALDDQLEEVSATLLEDAPGLRDGIYRLRSEVPVGKGTKEVVRARLASIGGSLAWYGIAPMWRLRLLLGRLWRERTPLRRPPSLRPGAPVDWWIADVVSPDTLVLRTQSWKPGEAWLAYRVPDEGPMRQAAALRPRGVPGLLYWKLLHPVHVAVFRAMARSLAARR